uniref:AlNc14C351G10910 protein n=1 Tax=Albugo laibachii Nc14 TaxID=890382 RepID=F0WXG0_9STRA|nr:AlNc14C351G10910 [Albugo laibachii Nc14]|eukprot:CCA26152.1 AlNc14C351G10910 [Albugo laibachii Nc14]
MVTIQAKKVAAEAAISPFSASGCWFNGFKDRHRVSFRAPPRIGQHSPALRDRFDPIQKYLISDCAIGWWNGGLQFEFLTYHFGGKASPNNPILILWDDFSSHCTAEVRECAKLLDVALLKVPPPSTAISQQEDVAWNLSLTSNLRRCWLDYLQYQVQQHRSETGSFRLAPPKRPMIGR